VDVRVEHSFPTRRSSDLNVNLGYTFADIAEKNWGVKSLRLYTSINNLLVVKSKGNHSYNPEGTTQGEVSGINSVPGVNYGSEPLDRKSTRLNSSHVKNSY